MAESTQSLAYADYREEIAVFLGYPRDNTAWSAAQIAAINSCLNSGLRQFYVQGDMEWSFMREMTTMTLWVDDAEEAGIVVSGGAYDAGDDKTTLTGTGTAFYPSMVGRTISCETGGDFVILAYTSATSIDVTGDASAVSAEMFAIASNGLFRLPDDCQDIEGGITYAADSAKTTMIQRDEAWIRAKRQAAGDSTGTPVYWAMVPAAFVAATGQRWDMILWPIPNEDLVVTYRKLINPDSLAASQYVRGGMVHSETILESCLAIAETRYGDSQGIHKAMYMENLAKSKAVDAKVGPETLGKNLDGSVGRGSSSRHGGTFGLLYKGILY